MRYRYPLRPDRLAVRAAFRLSQRGAGGSPGDRPCTLLAGVGPALAVVVWRAVLAGPDGRLHLTVLDVGSGDGILIQSPEGRFLLIDGGPSPSALASALGRRLPLGARRLDWLVVAGGEDEQIGALPRAIERFPPAQVLWAGPPDGSPSARELQAALIQARISVTDAQAGQALDLGQGAELQVLGVGRRGAVLLLKWKSFRALLPVGIDFEALLVRSPAGRSTG